jgi:hypothetical protein
MAALSTHELTELLTQFVARPGHMAVIGVFPADRLPSVQDLRVGVQGFGKCCFIANTDPVALPGQHWVAFVATLSGVELSTVDLEYFDSYGLPLAFYAHLHMACLRKRYLIRRSNNLMLQHMDSAVCGHYCVLLTYLRANGRDFDSSLRYIVHCGVNPSVRDNFVILTLHNITHRRRISCHNPHGLQFLRRNARSSSTTNQCCCAASVDKQ